MDQQSFPVKQNFDNLRLRKQLYSRGLNLSTTKNLKVTSKINASLYETDFFNNYGTKKY